MSLHLDALRPAAPTCPSDLALDRLEAGELAEQDASLLRGHAAGCAACRARICERQAGFAAFPSLDERALLAGIRRELDVPQPRRFWGRALGLVGACALVAIATFAVKTPQPETRAKGGLALHVFRAGTSKAEPMLSGDRFAPGDRLEFVVDLPSAGFVKIVGIEQSGALYSAWPLDPAANTRFDAGEKIALRGAVSLDDSVGRESLFLVHCPLDVGPPSCAAPTKPGDAPSCQSACAMTRFVLEKRK